ncbi:MAG TPA: ABC transporter ATP-binding protein [Candidatus Omnitrophota bacterium]|nr:ABC transporter ATP-binding protein [Candidatus Omnitrophota bacterium]
MLLELKNIKKYFSVGKTTVKAVDDISLALSKKEHLGLVGESGCGKTTLAKIILKLLKSDAGEIFFSQENMTYPSRDRLRDYRQKVQMVFQDPYSSLDPRFTIRNILNEALEGKKTDKGENHLDEILTAVQLPSSILYRYPHELSGGERQRVAIARALLVKPQLLILDEAVSSLDVIIQKQILMLLKGLTNEFDLTYLFISHNLKAVKRVCDKIAVMYQGRIVEYGFTNAILTRPLHSYTQKLLKASMEYRSDKIKMSDIHFKSHFVEEEKGHFVLRAL